MITQLRNITLLSVMIMSVVLGYAQISSQDVKVLERLLGSKVSLNNSEIQQILNQMRDPAMRKAALRRATYNLDVFYEVSVKNFATRMAVRSEEVSSPLNDFSATVIGIVRDNLDARQMLTGNFLYAANPTLIPAGINIRNNLINDRLNSNNHYLDIENNLYRLNVASILVQVPQEVLDVPVNNNPTINNVVPNPDPGGLLTSYTWGREHLVAGTNRRPVEYALRSFLCTPMELAADTLANDSHVGRDIDRNPGGDPNRYLTTCKGCHTIMDGFRGAFAMWNFAMNNNGGGILVHGSLHRNRLDINNGIARKMNQNANVYSDGFPTTNDSWINYATRPKNAEIFGWKGPYQGNGVGSFATLLAQSDRFPICMAKRVFNEVCARSQSPYKDVKNSVTEELARKFVESNYNLRELFIETASHEACK